MSTASRQTLIKRDPTELLSSPLYAFRLTKLMQGLHFIHMVSMLYIIYKQLYIIYFVMLLKFIKKN